jgi:hypothetical protein
MADNQHPTARQLVIRRLAAGWLPAKTVERLWIKPAAIQGTSLDRDLEKEAWDESEPMSSAEEQALLDWRWTDDG